MRARHFFRRVVDRPRRFVLVAAAAAITLAATTSITTAAWTDNEWVRSAVGVSSPGDCSTNTMFTNQSWARQLQGTVLNTSLDTVAGVQGLTVLNNGTTATRTPLSATLVPGTTDAYVTKIPVSVLGSSPISVGLGLGLPVGGVGTYTQWARSENSGQAHGASGLVSDQTGAVDVAGTAQGAATAPKSASISLGNIVPATLAGVTLDVGAVASSSQLDGCDMINGWPTLDPTPDDERKYGIAGLDLNAAIPAVGTLSTQGASLVGAVPTQLNAFLGTSGLGDEINNGIRGLVNPLLAGLALGSYNTTASLTTDLTGVTALMTESMTDGIVTINLGTGAVQVNIASLAGGTLGLNGMEPNHAVVLDAAMTTAVTNRVTALLSSPEMSSWKNRVLNALTAALGETKLEATTVVELRTLLTGPLAKITVKMGPTTLAKFADGSAPDPKVSLEVLGGGGGGLLSTLLTTLNSGANGVVQAALTTTGFIAKSTIFNTGLVANLGSSLQLLITPVINAVGPLLTAVRSLVAINVNVQPDQSWPGTKPADVTAAVGEYKVSAIRVGLVDSAGLLSLQLGSSSAGPVALAVP